MEMGKMSLGIGLRAKRNVQSKNSPSILTWDDKHYINDMQARKNK